jgi:hypothetical protein
MNKARLILLFVVLSLPLAIFAAKHTGEWKRVVLADTFDSTVIEFTIYLDGIGNIGDSTNSDSTGSNKDPDLYLKHLKISFYDRTSRLILTKTELLKFNYGEGAYGTDVELEDELPTGDYVIKVKVDGYLQRAFPLKHIQKGNTIALPVVNLIAGDLNGNNRLDIIDYHILTGCYSDVLPPTFCYPESNEVIADLSNDGKVNQQDYNLFMREISVHENGE